MKRVVLALAWFGAEQVNSGVLTFGAWGSSGRWGPDGNWDLGVDPPFTGDFLATRAG